MGVACVVKAGCFGLNRPTTGFPACDTALLFSRPYDSTANFCIKGLTIVPEPATLLLLAAGGLILVGRRRR